MPIKTLLQLLYKVSMEKGVSHPLIVGGVPRDKLLGLSNSSFSDIDITTGDETIFYLAKEFGFELRKIQPVTIKQALDGHVSLYLKDIKIDFSSHFLVPDIVNILKNQGIRNPSNMLQELYSRDFFCNTLLMSLDFKKIKDLTGEAVKDLKNKTIRTCLAPELTFKHNTNRIVRVLYLSAKLDFNVDNSIIEWIKNNQNFMLQSKTSYLIKNLDKAMTIDSDRTLYLINKMDLWKYIPITDKLLPYYNKRHRFNNVRK